MRDFPPSHWANSSHRVHTVADGGVALDEGEVAVCGVSLPARDVGMGDMLLVAVSAVFIRNWRG